MKKLRIVFTVDPEIPVPPLYYGGIERIVHMLICGLRKQGHEIHVFANKESKTQAIVIPYKGNRSNSFFDTVNNALQIRNYIKKIKRFDIAHSFSRMAYLAFILKSAIPKIQSYQRHITPRNIRLVNRLGAKNLMFTACSKHCAATADFIRGNWQVIYNGVEIEKYTFNSSVASDAPLVFLGRLTRIKGAHTAINVAKKTNKQLIIAGNHAERGEDQEYFQKEILAHCDQRLIRYIGPVDDVKKNELLSNAQALLFPIEWDEPFGIVMAEALACGTPVIAFSRGSVTEVIQDNINGFVCDDEEGMIRAVSNVGNIDRKNCREIAENKFSERVILEEYLQLYYRLLNKHNG